MSHRHELEAAVIACLMLRGLPLFDEPELCVADFEDVEYRRIFLAIRDGVRLEGHELERGFAACDAMPNLEAYFDYVEALKAAGQK